MAVGNAGVVQVDFRAQAAQLYAETKKINASLSGVERSLGGLSRVARTALGFFGAGISIAFIRSAAQAADELGKTADKLNVSTASLTAFRLAAQDAGVSLESMDKILLDSQRRLGEAASGRGEALKVLQQLNLNVRDLQALSPDELFLRYADAIGTLSNRSDQLAAAQALMGRSAQEAINLIDAGRPAIEQAQASVDRYGLALSRVDIKQIEIANDRLELLGKISATVGQRIAAGLSPFISAMAESLLSATGNTEGLQRKVEALGAASYTAFQLIANGVHTIQAAFFTVAAGGAQFLSTLTDVDIPESVRAAVKSINPLFGALLDIGKADENLSASLAASAQANIGRANDALAQVKSIEQIQEGIIDALEKSRRDAEAQVAEEEARRKARQETGTPLAADPIQSVKPPNADEFFKLLEERRKFQEQLQKEGEDFLEKYLTTYVAAEERRMEISAEAEEKIARFKQDGFNAAQSLLTAYHGKYKGIATALLAFEKAQAIASTIINTKEAVMKTFAKYGATPFGYAAVAGIVALGAAQVAAIASTVIGGGSNAPSLGAPNNPVFTDDANGGEERQFGATSKPATQIIVQGNIFSAQETAEWFLEQVAERVNEGDVVIIDANSRQAQELRAPA